MRSGTALRWTNFLFASLLCCALASTPLAPRGSELPVSQMRFERISDREGLGSNAVRHILQDSRGYLWIVTEASINRYDGIRFKHYQLDNPRANGNQPALSIFEDVRGNLWAGGRDGQLNRFDPNTDSFRQVPNLPTTLARADVHNFAAGNSESLWLGTNRGLVRYDSATNRADIFIPRPQPMIFSLARDSHGQLWVGTTNGLLILDQGSGVFSRVLLSANEVPGERLIVNSLFNHPPSGTLFVGTEKGLFAVDTARRSWKTISSIIPLPMPPDTRVISSILALDEHKLIVGIQGAGLALLDLNRSQIEWIKHNPKKADSIVGDAVRTVLLDRSGVLWVGDYIAGLSKYSSAQHLFRLYRNDPFDDRTLSGNYIRGIHEAHDGKLWVCTQFNGLNLIDPKTGDTKRYRRATGALPYDGTYAVLEDQVGEVWVGLMANNGLARLDRRTDRFVRYPGFPRLNVTALYEDSKRTLWVGTSGGVYSIDRNRKTVVHHPEFINVKPGTSADDIEAVLVDSKGDIWIGLDSRLLTFVRSTGVLIDRSPGLGITTRETFVCGFLESGDTIWIATKGAGVFRYDRNSDRLTALTQIDGLPNNNTYGVLNDSKGRLWISTDVGIVRFDPLTNSMVPFGLQHGLQGKEFNRAAFGRSRSGDLFFGGTNGLNGFTPELVEISETKAPVTISGLSVNGVPMAVTSEIDLNYTRNTIAVELAVLDFNAPELNRYEVQLDGFDDDWVALGNEARVVYSHLSPGDYVLRVKGSNSAGIWNEATSPVRIRIRPPWWQTGWAITVYILLALGVIGGLGATVRYRSLTRSRLSDAAATARAALAEKKTEQERAEVAVIHSRELAQAEATIRAKNEQLAGLVEELTASERTAQEATRAKSEFLASISHEIRTPLNAVLGMAHILLRSNLSETQKESALTIRAAGGALMALLDDVLDLSKIEADALELHLQPVDIRECVEESVSLISCHSAQKGIDVTLSVDEDVPPIIVSDQNRLRQVLVNLLGNAVKFTDHGWVAVHVSASPLNGATGDYPYRLEFSIRDTGIGISADRLSDLFKMFSRADNSMTRRFGGTGLGLAISRRIMTALGGDIDVESDVGVGSTFRAWIVAEAVGQTVQPILDESAAGQTAGETESAIRILVADDSEVNRCVVQQMLASLGMKADLVSSGTEVIEAMLLKPYDVILIDVHMPDMDGIEVTRRIRATRRDQAVRIIALTADVITNTRKRCLEAGMDDVLTKPVEVEQLRLAILESAVAPEVRPMPTRAILNRERFESVLSLSSKAGSLSFRALVDPFITQCDDTLDRLSQAFDKGSLEQVGKLAHKLAGTAATLGAERLATASRHLQACAMSELHDSIRASIDSLRSEYAQLRDELLRSEESHVAEV